MEGFGGPAQPSPTIAQALNGGFSASDARLAPAFRSSTSAAATGDTDLEARGLAIVSAVRALCAAPAADHPDRTEEV